MPQGFYDSLKEMIDKRVHQATSEAMTSFMTRAGENAEDKVKDTLKSLKSVESKTMTTSRAVKIHSVSNK
jgi:hypothetical protein